jgi:glucose/arabinose dehydrogenase
MQLRRLIAAALVTTSVTAALVIVRSNVASAAPSLPAGFRLIDSASGQAQYDLTDFAYLPDGSMITTGKMGNVAWVSPAGDATSIATFPVNSQHDVGLVSVAIDRDYATNHRIYLAGNRFVQVSKDVRDTTFWVTSWTVTGDDHPTGLTNEQTVLEYPAFSEMHGLTGLVVGSDGTLWVSTGDSSDFYATQALSTMDLNTPYGKLMHINPDGTGVATNPYYDQANASSWRSRVYASGFRSPFRFTLDPASGTPILGDVGWNLIEEVDLVRPGAFYGWPCWEANLTTWYVDNTTACAGVQTANPVWSYPRDFGGSSVTGGIVYTGASYPDQYKGAYFFGDYTGHRLWTMTFKPDGSLDRAPEANAFATDIGGPVKFATGPNGDIVYADILTGTLHRLTYTPGNRPPVAKVTTTNDPDTLTVTFDASESYDLDGDPLTYAWDFGDGLAATGTGPKQTHQYTDGNTPRTVTLTVTDPLNASGSQQLTVVPANHVPVLTVQFPPADRTYRVGDQVSVSATATDAEDGDLQVTWTSELLHCRPIGCHSHPGSGGTGPTFTTPFTDHGEDTRLQITAHAVDSRGAATEQTYVAQPLLRTLTLVSNLPATMHIGDQAVAQEKLTVGSVVSVDATTTATDGVATFDSWADGGNNHTRQFPMPDNDLTLTATYLTPIDRRYASDANFRAILGPPTAPEGVEGKVHSRVYQNGRAYWSPTTAVYEVHGSILGQYLNLGGPAFLGPPVTDELTTPDGVGRYNHFAKADGPASIYWSPGTGAHEIFGSIRAKWAEKGWEAGVLGYPTTGENGTPDGMGRYNHFSKGGSIYYSPGSGTWEVHGAIRSLWEQLRWETGPLGYPVTDETTTPDGIGRYNHFTKGGSIYWSPGTGAHEVYGAIRGRWAQLGWERSYLGYPTSGEYSVPGGRRNDFQHGYIFWNASNGQVTDVRR